VSQMSCVQPLYLTWWSVSDTRNNPEPSMSSNSSPWNWLRSFRGGSSSLVIQRSWLWIQASRPTSNLGCVLGCIPPSPFVIFQTRQSLNVGFRWTATPWYRAEATGLRYYRDKLLVAIGWFNAMPGPEYVF
jgi:hypothetical protein